MIILSQTILAERYQLLEVVGQGGMATVYKAKDLVLNRIVAIKILDPQRTHEKELIQRFLWEAKATGRLSHENIVNIYDIKNENQTYFMVMEYVDGITLKELIQQEGKLSTEKAIQIAIKICDALTHAHQNGIIHRDIKPQNIICTADHQYRITDFGISRFIQDPSNLTKTGNVVGTVHYVSPEQAQGKPVDITTDLYSLGVVLYEMVIGQPPYDAPEQIAIALMHIHHNIPNPKERNPELPNALAELIQKAMAKQASDRFQSAEEMKEKLEQIQTMIYANTSDSNSSQQTKANQRAKKIWGITTVVSVLFLTLFFTFYAEAKFFQKQPTNEKKEMPEQTLPLPKQSPTEKHPAPSNQQPKQPDLPNKEKKDEPTDQPVQQSPPQTTNYIIVVGSFQQQEHANRLMKNLNQQGFRTTIQTSTVFGSRLYRVVAGEFSSIIEAEQHLKQIKQSGIEGTQNAVLVDMTAIKKKPHK